MPEEIQSKDTASILRWCWVATGRSYTTDIDIYTFRNAEEKWLSHFDKT